ncbi:hypothetical protein TCELL_0406 [Thermogladius calderae 1633]|uniref:Exosome protein n=1 Tax=Thermogladius calderae (strain DSM 22663 / VKM B-2946 / 1633) TaxID=1184251 RepID=I3TDJ3_THEC1|nr:RNA-binding domain-containing protein [Thermogladius calderae]AFK50831.1 hypothetical protein TCELL_0406 [Thermogladius calderae 1633]
MERGRKEEVKLGVKEVEVSTHCHATEDCSRVLVALHNVIPAELRDRVRVEEEDLEGFYGNRIKVMKIRVGEKGVLENILRNLGKTDRSLLNASLDLRFDGRTGRFFIRLDKQSLFQGKFVLNDADDVVKVVVHFKGLKNVNELRSLLDSIPGE